MKSLYKKLFVNLITGGHELAVFFANEKLFIKKRRTRGYNTYSMDNDSMDNGVLYENAIKEKISRDY
ncbi:hypothetical protein GCM10023261_07230 [Bartonella jaculi]|uniref:Uncharacterized protein n=1 Tax=Bartonella jaculi TaxID=686226 RepID=A0ABP9N103_9HYPH